MSNWRNNNWYNRSRGSRGGRGRSRGIRGSKPNKNKINFEITRIEPSIEFTITCKPQNNQLERLLLTIPDCKLLPGIHRGYKHFKLPRTRIDRAKRIIEDSKFHPKYKICEPDKCIFQIFDHMIPYEKVESLEDKKLKEYLSQIPKSITDRLYDFQKVGVHFIIENRGRGLIGDDMGLGKTIQAIACAAYYKEWPILVVCPSSVKFSWQQEFLDWIPAFTRDNIHVIKTGRDKYIKEYAGCKQTGTTGEYKLDILNTTHRRNSDIRDLLKSNKKNKKKSSKKKKSQSKTKKKNKKSSRKKLKIKASSKKKRKKKSFLDITDDEFDSDFELAIESSTDSDIYEDINNNSDNETNNSGWEFEANASKLYEGSGNDKKKYVYIMSYGLVKGLSDTLLDSRFSMVICDESHYIKNIDAQRTKFLLPVIHGSKRVILLSGTPALARPMELYSQIYGINRKLLPGKTSFGQRYCDPKPNSFTGYIEYKGNDNLTELNLLLSNYVMIRRKKQEVLTMLPNKTRTAILANINDKAIESIKTSLGDNITNLLSKIIERATYDKEYYNSIHENKNELGELYQKSGVAKVKASLDYIKSLLEANQKFLVFAHHREVMDKLEAGIRKFHTGYFRLDGSTPSKKRQEFVDNFNSNDNIRIGLISITAGGQGITLTAANLVVFAELNWSPAYLIQAEDRVHRIGQKNACMISYIIGKGTIDDILWPMIASKLKVTGKSLDGKESEMNFETLESNDGTKHHIQNIINMKKFNNHKESPKNSIRNMLNKNKKTPSKMEKTKAKYKSLFDTNLPKRRNHKLSQNSNNNNNNFRNGNLNVNLNEMNNFKFSDDKKNNSELDINHNKVQNLQGMGYDLFKILKAYKRINSKKKNSISLDHGDFFDRMIDTMGNMSDNMSDNEFEIEIKENNYNTNNNSNNDFLDDDPEIEDILKTVDENKLFGGMNNNNNKSYNQSSINSYVTTIPKDNKGKETAGRPSRKRGKEEMDDDDDEEEEDGWTSIKNNNKRETFEPPQKRQRTMDYKNNKLTHNNSSRNKKKSLVLSDNSDDDVLTPSLNEMHMRVTSEDVKMNDKIKNNKNNRNNQNIQNSKMKNDSCNINNNSSSNSTNNNNINEIKDNSNSSNSGCGVLIECEYCFKQIDATKILIHANECVKQRRNSSISNNNSINYGNNNSNNSNNSNNNRNFNNNRNNINNRSFTDEKSLNNALFYSNNNYNNNNYNKNQNNYSNNNSFNYEKSLNDSIFYGKNNNNNNNNYNRNQNMRQKNNDYRNNNNINQKNTAFEVLAGLDSADLEDFFAPLDSEENEAQNINNKHKTTIPNNNNTNNNRNNKENFHPRKKRKKRQLDLSDEEDNYMDNKGLDSNYVDLTEYGLDDKSNSEDNTILQSKNTYKSQNAFVSSITSINSNNNNTCNNNNKNNKSIVNSNNRKVFSNKLQFSEVNPKSKPKLKPRGKKGGFKPPRFTKPLNRNTLNNNKKNNNFKNENENENKVSDIFFDSDSDDEESIIPCIYCENRMKRLKCLNHEFECPGILKVTK